jgi:hypothetical protein
LTDLVVAATNGVQAGTVGLIKRHSA